MRLAFTASLATACAAFNAGRGATQQLHRTRLHAGGCVSRYSSQAIRAGPVAEPPSGAVEEAPPAPAPVHLPTNEENPDLVRIRHSASHVMAMAVQKIWKDAKVTIGPWIDKGFYYDFDIPVALQDKDLRKIKKQMDRYIQQKLPFRVEEVSREEARRRITELNEPYKLEILDSIKTEPITIWHTGDNWWDLCAGPHVEHTGQLPKDAISLESIAGAYWRGDETRPMLQRIYGTAWETAEQLKEHERLQAEAKRRDHRVIGKALNLFSIQPDAGGGLVFWHPKGSRVRRMMEEYWRDAHVAKGYELLYTPHMASIDLWKTSGHIDFYKVCPRRTCRVALLPTEGAAPD